MKNVIRGPWLVRRRAILRLRVNLWKREVEGTRNWLRNRERTASEGDPYTRQEKRNARGHDVSCHYKNKRGRKATATES
jgi:hypothetical protein